MTCHTVADLEDLLSLDAIFLFYQMDEAFITGMRIFTLTVTVTITITFSSVSLCITVLSAVYQLLNR